MNSMKLLLVNAAVLACKIVPGKATTFVIPIEPKSVQHGARVGRGRFYNDPKKLLYYDTIKKEVGDRPPMTGELLMLSVFYMERTKRLLGKKAERGAMAHCQKPDLDNLDKGLGDALANAGVLLDDKQIFGRLSFKLYREIELFPRIEVAIIETRKQ